MEVRGRGPAKLRRLSDPKHMIGSWSQYVEHQKPPSVERYYSPLLDSRELMKGIDHACHERGIPYAITGEAATQAYAPFKTSISQVRCRMVPSGNQRAVLAAVDARPVDEGWNLAVVPVRNEAEARAANRIGGVGYASPYACTWICCSSQDARRISQGIYGQKGLARNGQTGSYRRVRCRRN